MIKHYRHFRTLEEIIIYCSLALFLPSFICRFILVNKECCCFWMKYQVLFFNQLWPKNSKPIVTAVIFGFVIQGTGLELKKISKWPFGDYRRKNGRQMQKCSCQIVQEQKLKLEPHLISVVFRLPVDCFCVCGTDRNTRYGRT